MKNAVKQLLYPSRYCPGKAFVLLTEIPQEGQSLWFFL